MQVDGHKLIIIKHSHREQFPQVLMNSITLFLEELAVWLFGSKRIRGNLVLKSCNDFCQQLTSDSVSVSCRI